MRGVKDAAAGWNGTMAVKDDGSVWSWGTLSSIHPNHNSPTQVSLPPGVVPSFIGATIYQFFLLDLRGSLFYWGSPDGTGSKITDKVIQLEGDYRWSVPQGGWWDWSDTFRWLFLGKADKGSAFFQMPVEIVYHFVCMIF
jgi:hypothetical protein